MRGSRGGLQNISLGDYTSDYNSYLLTGLLLLMLEFEINDVLFFIRRLKSPASHLDITNYRSFCDNARDQANYFDLTHISTDCLGYGTVCQLSILMKPMKSNKFRALFENNFNYSVAGSFHLVCTCFSCSHIPHSIL